MMSLADDDVVAPDALLHLHTLLLDAVRHRRSTDPHQVPVTVAEIYQELVPYRHVRAALGLELNADYEHTLLRLLAGESQLARLEPDTARDQLARELESANPNVAIYRKFAACDVWLLRAPVTTTPAWVAEHLEEDEPEPPTSARVPLPRGTFTVAEDVEADDADTPAFATAEAEVEAVSDADVALPDAGVATQAGVTAHAHVAPADLAHVTEEELEAPLAHVFGEDAGPAPVISATPRAPRPAARPQPEVQQARCGFCDSALPRSRVARYCPYCGSDQRQRPCASCGEVVEPGWAYCIACGEAAPAGGA